MLAKNSAGIFAGGSRFGTKARRPGTRFDRQTLRLQSFVAVEVGQLGFGGWREPQVGSFQAKHVRRELRQLPNAC